MFINGNCSYYNEYFSEQRTFLKVLILKEIVLVSSIFSSFQLAVNFFLFFWQSTVYILMPLSKLLIKILSYKISNSAKHLMIHWQYSWPPLFVSPSSKPFWPCHPGRRHLTIPLCDTHSLGLDSRSCHENLGFSGLWSQSRNMVGRCWLAGRFGFRWTMSNTQSRGLCPINFSEVYSFSL